MVTGAQIQSDVISYIRGVEFAHNGAKCTLAGSVGGGVYRAGLRPRDSRKEDIIVTFLTGKNYDYQTAVVNVTIYVPDIRPYDNGVYVENMARTAALESVAADWVAALNAGATPGYKIRCEDAITTEEDGEIMQHFVYVKLNINHYDR